MAVLRGNVFRAVLRCDAKANSNRGEYNHRLCLFCFSIHNVASTKAFCNHAIKCYAFGISSFVLVFKLLAFFLIFILLIF